jgi:tetratricopeptide (TPR) repeat protein
MNAYEQFRSMRPDAVIAGEVLVFNGTYQVPKAAALSHLVVANTLLRSGQADRAMTEAKAAAGLDADLRFSHELLASLYFKYKQFEQARNEYQAALRVYQTVEPEFQELFGPPENPFPETKTAALTSTGK